MTIQHAAQWDIAPHRCLKCYCSLFSLVPQPDNCWVWFRKVCQTYWLRYVWMRFLFNSENCKCTHILHMVMIYTFIKIVNKYNCMYCVYFSIFSIAMKIVDNYSFYHFAKSCVCKGKKLINLFRIELLIN